VTTPTAHPDVALRLWAEDDLWLLRRLLGEPEMMRFLGGPESPEAIGARHRRYLTADPTTSGLFAIVAGAEAELVGWTGFWESEWEGEAVWECGWSVLPEAQGRGVAARAAALIVDEARRRRRHRWICAFPSADNAASNALCRTLGFESRGETEVEYPKDHLMRSNEWRLDLWPA
jgi:RimJ/RimL family protein N-acetyltransferase